MIVYSITFRFPYNQYVCNWKPLNIIHALVYREMMKKKMIKLNLFSFEENSSPCRKEETWLKVERVLIMKMNKYPSVARLIVSYMSFYVIFF